MGKGTPSFETQRPFQPRGGGGRSLWGSRAWPPYTHTHIPAHLFFPTPPTLPHPSVVLRQRLSLLISDSSCPFRVYIYNLALEVGGQDMSYFLNEHRHT